jgi:hypothetical protein
LYLPDAGNVKDRGKMKYKLREEKTTIILKTFQRQQNNLSDKPSKGFPKSGKK